MTTLWLSPLDDGCQLCGKPWRGVMYDASTSLGWANICSSCFEDGKGPSHRRGQRYELQPHGEAKAWVKVAG